MTDTTSADSGDNGPVLAADGTPLKQSLSRSLRTQKMRALMLIAPLLLFVLISFILPIGSMLFRSVENGMVAETIPLTVVALEDWDTESGELPDENVYDAFVKDMLVAIENKTHTRLGSRLNYEQTGMSSMFRRSGRAIKKLDPVADAPFKEKLIDIHEGWGDVQTWSVIKTHDVKYTNGYFLNAVDMRRTPEGAQAQPEDKRILLKLFGRTLMMSLIITGSCILLGYPVAYILANLPTRTSILFIIIVLWQFWKSLLEPTSA